MVNRVVLVGRLTKDPMVKKTQTGKSVVSYTVAINRRFSQEDQKADFINCVSWEKTADFLGQYAKKGALISVEGRIQSRSYDDSTGKRVYVTEVSSENVQLLESRSTNEGRTSNPTYSSTASDYQSDTDTFNDDNYDSGPILDISSDDLPF